MIRLLLVLSFLSLLKSVVAQQPFQFAIVTDLHIGGAASAEEDLQRTVADINRNSAIRFAIFTGDITELGSDAELRLAHSLLSKLTIPWYVIPGNHDTKWSESGNQSFRQVFGDERFCFDYQDYTFIGCSSGPNMRMAPGLVPAEDIVWLDSIVSSINPKTPVFFFNHYPLDEGLGNWYKVTDLLRKINTQAAFCGHGHANKAFLADGIPSAMCRSNLRAKADYGGYNLITVTPDSLLMSVKKPGTAPMAPWHTIPLGFRDYTADTTLYRRPSFAVNEAYPSVKPRWKIQDACDIGSGIAVSGKLVVAANTCGTVKGLDLTTGNLKWSFQTKGKIYATPALADDKVVIASADSTIYCLNSGNGLLLWSFKTGKAIVASPVIADGVIYIGSSEGKFRALSLDDGQLLWTYQGVEGFVETKPLVDRQRVYFGSWGNQFYALNRKTGSLAWTWNNGRSNRMFSPAAVFPVTADGKVFIVAPDRFVTALASDTGKPAWRSPGKIGRESIGLSENGRTLFVKSMNDTIYALSTTAKGFEQSWAMYAGYGYDIAPSPLVEKNGILYVPTDKGVVQAIDTRTKTVKWQHKLSNALVNNLLPLNDGSVLGSTMDGIIFYLN
jgi:outer membrane protein assembly factor BamB/Icc-related predicted phosphoesterase